MKQPWSIWLALALMIVFALTRLPGLMPLNFSAAYALAFCAGAYFPPKWRYPAPLATLLLTDLFLNWYWGVSSFDPKIILFEVTQMASFALLVWLGKTIGARASWLKLVAGGLLGAILFYLISNTVSWLADPAYLKTIAGWIQALTVGRPEFPHTWEFFRNTLMSGGLFTGLFAGAMKLSEAAEPESDEESAPEPADTPINDPAPEESGA